MKCQRTNRSTFANLAETMLTSLEIICYVGRALSGVMLSHRVLNSYWIAILYHSVVSRKFLVEEIYSSYNWTCLHLHSKLTGLNVSHCSNTIVYHEENRTQLLQQSTQIKVLKVLNAHVVHVTRDVTFSKTRR